jgi:hypothetical protein
VYLQYYLLCINRRVVFTFCFYTAQLQFLFVFLAQNLGICFFNGTNLQFTYIYIFHHCAIFPSKVAVELPYKYKRCKKNTLSFIVLLYLTFEKCLRQKLLLIILPILYYSLYLIRLYLGVYLYLDCRFPTLHLPAIL